MKTLFDPLLRSQALRLFCLLAISPLASHALTISTTTGTAVQAPVLTGFSTTGDDMDGMLVTFGFADGSFLGATWATTAPSSGAAAAGGATLSVSGDTYGAIWTLANASGKGINYLSLSGAPGNTLFDIYFGDAFGTDGSFRGIDFTNLGGFASASVLYTNKFNLTGDPAVGDLYERMVVSDFLLLSGSSATFEQDTDNADSSVGRILPVPDGGMTSLLLSLGLAGFSFFHRRRAA